MYNSDIPARADLPSSKQLVRSTLIAIAAAVTLLIAVVLPAEYGIDPTGIGGALGLKEMGDIKVQLAEEAAPAEPAPLAAPVVAATPITQEATAPTPEDIWQDEVVITLKPGEAAEIKLEMDKDALVTYEWTTDQGHLNSDLHADGAGKAFISYRKGRKEVSDTGDLTAAFNGAHGWFWRNRSKVDVTVTLKIKGSYGEIKRVV